MLYACVCLCVCEVTPYDHGNSHGMITVTVTVTVTVPVQNFLSVRLNHCVYDDRIAKASHGHGIYILATHPEGI
jgi:hypothetical protein